MMGEGGVGRRETPCGDIFGRANHKPILELNWSSTRQKNWPCLSIYEEEKGEVPIPLSFPIFPISPSLSFLDVGIVEEVEITGTPDESFWTAGRYDSRLYNSLAKRQQNTSAAQH